MGSRRGGVGEGPVDAESNIAGSGVGAGTGVSTTAGVFGFGLRFLMNMPKARKIATSPRTAKPIPIPIFDPVSMLDDEPLLSAASVAAAALVLAGVAIDPLEFVVELVVLEDEVGVLIKDVAGESVFVEMELLLVEDGAAGSVRDHPGSHVISPIFDVGK